MSEHDEPGLAHAFHEKAIGVRGMDRGLLVLTVLAAVLVVLAGVLLAMSDVAWPRVAATIGGPELTIPVPVLIGCSVFLVLAWSYLLAGALHAHLALRVLGLVAWTAGAAAMLAAVPSVQGWIAVALPALAVWAAAIAMWLVDRLAHDRGAPERHHRARLRLLTFGFVAAATAALFAVGALGGLESGALAFSIQTQLGVLQFLLVPMLYVAGTDFAEWSEIAAGRVVSALARLGRDRAAWVTAGLLAIAAALVLAERARVSGALPAMAEALVPLALIAAAGIVAVRARAAVRIPFPAIVLAGLAGVGSLLLGSYVQCALGYCQAGGDVPYSHREAPAFSLRYDPAWTPTTRHVPGGGDAVVFEGTDATRLPVRFVVLAADRGDPLTTSLPALMGGPVSLTGEAGRRDGWDVRDYTIRLDGTDFRGRAWTRTEHGERWLLTGIGPLLAGGGHDAEFQRMVSSWEPTAASGQGSEQREGESAAADLTLSFGFTIAPFLWLPAVVAAVLLLRRGGATATGGLFVIAAAAFFLCNGIRWLFAAFFGGATPLPPWIVAQGIANTSGTIAACVLAALAVLAATRRLAGAAPALRLMLVLLLGLVGLRLIDELVFGVAQAGSDGRPIVAGVVLILALLWDVVMSGENLTNRRGRHVPRHSRVLLYFGYTMLVATAVLFFSALRGPGAGSVATFESETWPRGGISAMGAPLLLTFFVVNLGAWLRRRGGSEGARIG